MKQVVKDKSALQSITVWHWISMLMDAVIMICGVVNKNWALILLGIYMLNSDLRYHLQQWDIKQLQDRGKDDNCRR